jgi:hypothetical protein
MTIEAEDFKAWLDNPVTERVWRLLREKQAECKSAWLAASWDQNKCDPVLLADLRARSELLSDLENIEFEDIRNDE